jgi:hypothetical protein
VSAKGPPYALLKHTLGEMPDSLDPVASSLGAQGWKGRIREARVKEIPCAWKSPRFIHRQMEERPR